MLIDLLGAMPPWVDSRVYTLYPGVLTGELRALDIPVDEDQLRGVASLRAIPRLAAKFREFKPHIVHTHLAKADFTGRLAGSRARVPIVMSTAHNLEEWREKPLLNLLDKFSRRSADAVIAIAQGVADFQMEHGLPAHKLRISYVRSNLAGRFAPECGLEEKAREIRSELGLSEETLVTVMVGRMDPQKAHDVAIEALAGMDAASLGRPHVLLFAGDGPLRSAHEQLAKDRLPDGACRFLGIRRDIPALLTLADVYLMPSRWEGLGLALAEACAAGLPSVVSDVPGMEELARSCGGSLFVPPEDAGALASEWKKLLLDENLRRELGERARQNALEKWDIQLMAREYLEIYAGLCANSAGIDPSTLPGELMEMAGQG